MGLTHNFCTIFLSPGTEAGILLGTISTQFSQPGAVLFKSAAVQDRDVSALGSSSHPQSDWAAILGVQNVWGGKTYGGRKNVPENVLSRKLLDPSKRASGLLSHGFLYRKTQH